MTASTIDSFEEVKCSINEVLEEMKKYNPVLVQGIVGGVIDGLFVCSMLYIFKYRKDK